MLVYSSSFHLDSCLRCNNCQTLQRCDEYFFFRKIFMSVNATLRWNVPPRHLWGINHLPESSSDRPIPIFGKATIKKPFVYLQYYVQ